MGPNKETSELLSMFNEPRYSLQWREDMTPLIRTDILIPYDTPQNFILGPCLKKMSSLDFSNEYPRLGKSTFVEHGLGCSWHSWSKSWRTWPLPDAMWTKWVARMEQYCGDDWRGMGIYEAIKLSTIEFSPDKALVAAFCCFWCTDSNSFMFSWGPMTPTIFDVSALIGVFPDGITVSPDLVPSKLVHLSPARKRYSDFFDHYSKIGSEDPPEDVEKVAFVLYWLSKYLFCVRAQCIAREYINLATKLAIDKDRIAMAPYILGILYRSLSNIVANRIDHKFSGPLWLLQAWGYTYFPCFRPDPFTEINILCYAQRALFCKPSSKSFDDIFLDLATNNLMPTPAAFVPMMSKEYGPFWFRNLSTSEDDAKRECEEEEELTSLWGSFLVPRLLIVGCFLCCHLKSVTCSFEPYNPNQAARQFGLIQTIPVPHLPADFVEPRERPSFRNIEIVRMLEKDYRSSLTRFRLQNILIAPSTTKDFTDWWTMYYQNKVHGHWEVRLQVALGNGTLPSGQVGNPSSEVPSLKQSPGQTPEEKQVVMSNVPALRWPKPHERRIKSLTKRAVTNPVQSFVSMRSSNKRKSQEGDDEEEILVKQPVTLTQEEIEALAKSLPLPTSTAQAPTKCLFKKKRNRVAKTDRIGHQNSSDPWIRKKGSGNPKVEDQLDTGRTLEIPPPGFCPPLVNNVPGQVTDGRDERLAAHFQKVASYLSQGEGSSFLCNEPKFEENKATLKAILKKDLKDLVGTPEASKLLEMLKYFAEHLDFFDLEQGKCLVGLKTSFPALSSQWQEWSLKVHELTPFHDFLKKKRFALELKQREAEVNQTQLAKSAKKIRKLKAQLVKEEAFYKSLIDEREAIYKEAKELLESGGHIPIGQVSVRAQIEAGEEKMNDIKKIYDQYRKGLSL